MFEEVGIREGLRRGWVFIKCPECQRGIPFDIIAGHLIKKTPEVIIQGFCPQHWFRDSGICSYCMMRRTAANRDAESRLQQQQYEAQDYGGADGQDAIA
jgi:hypothetical protein